MRNLKIFQKLFISHITIGLFSIIILTGIYYYQLKEAILQRTVEQLSSINILKKNQIENYFYRTEKNLLFLFQQKEFLQSYRALLTRGKKDNPTLKDAPLFENIGTIRDLYDFENIILVDSDFIPLHSLVDDTNFVYKLRNRFVSIKSSTTAFHLIDASHLFGNTSILVYMIPLIVQDDQIIGYVIIKEKFQKIENFLHVRTGMGNTGESYLVADDYSLRSSSRFYPDTNYLLIKVNSSALQSAKAEVKGRHIIEDYRGEQVLSVARPLGAKSLQWIVVTEMDYSEAVKSINQLKNYLLFISLVIFFLVVIVTILISSAISQPILKLKDRIVLLSKGIIPELSPFNSKNEIGEITVATNGLIEGLKRTTEFANEIGKGNFTAEFTTLSEKDTLGFALLSMRDKLIALNQREVKLVREKGAALMEGQENERKRIVQELHDGVGQLLTVVKLRLEAIEGQEIIKQEIIALVNEIITEVRRISYNVMPSALVDFGLEAALKGLCDTLKRYSKMDIQFDYVKESDDKLNFEVSIVVFRIIQEALNNIIKHSKATLVELLVVKRPDEIYLMLKDNGIGFLYDKSNNTGGMGLHNMRERAKFLNGNVEIHSGVGSGTVIEVTIPRIK